MSVESEDAKEAMDKVRYSAPGLDEVDRLARLRTRVRGLKVDLSLGIGGIRSSPFSVKNSSCWVEESV